MARTKQKKQTSQNTIQIDIAELLYLKNLEIQILKREIKSLRKKMCKCSKRQELSSKKLINETDRKETVKGKFYEEMLETEPSVIHRNLFHGSDPEKSDYYQTISDHTITQD